MQRALATTVVIAYGTDAGVFPHAENNKDFALLVRMGMRPTDVPRSADGDRRRTHRRERPRHACTGETGNVVAFNGDPTRDISLIEKPPALILLGGKRSTPQNPLALGNCRGRFLEGYVSTGLVVDRGLEGVVVGHTDLSNVEGQIGRLTYRGYDIDDLAPNATFEEVAHSVAFRSPPQRHGTRKHLKLNSHRVAHFPVT